MSRSRFIALLLLPDGLSLVKISLPLAFIAVDVAIIAPL
jgi:hypothetical protein